MSQQTVKTLNQAKAQAFGDRMLDTLNKAAAALMISAGHRTGLFDTLVDLPHATSERIAKAAGLDERYVREWLGAMVTARIVDYDPAGGTYFLPREHRAIHPGARLGGERDRRVFPKRRRRSIFVVPSLPRGDGRGEQSDCRRRPD
jgi:hypothetical protein